MVHSEQPGQSGRLYEIDLFRFVAAFAVVLNHYTWRSSAGTDHLSPVSYPELAAFGKYGLLGVQLFFIISGYVVLRSAYGKTTRQFLLSRVTRLYPAFWVACTLTFIIIKLAGPHVGDVAWGPDFEISFGGYLRNLTMLHEFVGQRSVDGVYWTLAVEIAFYFLISLLIGYDLLRQLPLLCFFWLLIAAAMGPNHAIVPFEKLFIPSYAPYFVAGIAFFMLQNKLAPRWQLFGLLLFSYGLALRQVNSYGITTGANLNTYFSFAVMASCITVFYGLFFLTVYRVLNLERFTFLSKFGALTYPLYLLHGIIGYIALQHFGGQMNKYVLLVLLILAMLTLAQLIHSLIEKRFGKQFSLLVSRLLKKYFDAYPMAQQKS